VLGETDLFEGTVVVFSWLHFKNDGILFQGSSCARWNWKSWHPRHINSRRWVITQKKAYNTQKTGKAWN